MFLSLIIVLWYIRSSKQVLFWLYLWQLKEYHVGRFFAHFKTSKGQNLIINPIQNFKVLLAILLLLNNVIVTWIVALIYFAEAFAFFRSIYFGNVKRPKITKKTLPLIFISFVVLTLFPIAILTFSNDIIRLTLHLLAFDILVPLIISAIVLFFQPLAVFARTYIIWRATKKIERLKPNGLKVIGITGSYGKTSTKEFLTTILSEKFKVLSTKDHQNSEMGISRCILNNLNSNHEIFVVEMGSYNKGGIKLLADIVKPDIGIVTGVNEQHLALFGSLDNLLSAEGGRELANALPEDGLLVLNGDNKYCLDLFKRTSKRKKIYSLNRKKVDSDIWADEITVKRDFVSFAVINRQKEMASFQVNVFGKQNVQNILGAVFLARELGMNFDEIVKASENIKHEQSGILLKEGKHGISVIDSSYSSNPDGVIADLEYLDIFPRKKVVVMPCLIELGSKSAEIHRKIGEKIGQVCDLAIITTKEMFWEIKTSAVEKGMKEKNIVFCEDPEEILTRVSIFCTKGDAVLLEGRVPDKILKKLEA